MTANIKIEELAFDNVSDLSTTELAAINGGSVGGDIGETLGYFFGYIFTAGPRMVTLLL
jgi:hypothetical protein